MFCVITKEIQLLDLIIHIYMYLINNLTDPYLFIGPLKLNWMNIIQRQRARYL